MSAKRPTDALAARFEGLSAARQTLFAHKLTERVAQREARGISDRIVPRTGRGAAPLSTAQEMIWLYEQMTPGTAAYNVPVVRRVRGPLDLALLQRAVDELVVRHESLRTAFAEMDGMASQSVLAERTVPLEVHDLRALDPAPGALECERILAEASARPFDLAAGAFPRVAVVRLADEHAQLLIVIHHLVFDGASVGVLFRDLAASFEAALDGRATPSAPLPIQMADHAVWESRAMVGARLESAINFWRSYLSGAPKHVELPSRASTATSRSGPSGRVTAAFPVELLDGVRQLASREGATAFMVLLAAFQALLHRYSGQEDLVVGIPFADRSRPETQALIGDLTNTLPLRANLSADPTFLELLAQVRRGCLDAFAHRDISYRRVVQGLAADALADLASPFDVLFVMQDGGAMTTSFGAATLEPVSLGMPWTAFLLSVSVTETKDGLRLVIDYRSDLFSAPFIEGFVHHLRVLMDAAIVNPSTRVSLLPLLDAGERHVILRDWNQTRVPARTDRAVHDVIVERSAAAPDDIAVRSEEGSLTYGELVRRSQDVAELLLSQGAKAGQLVAVALERSLFMVVAMLGVLMSGCACVPVDLDDPDDRIGFIMHDANATFVISAPKFRERMARHAVPVLVAADLVPSASHARVTRLADVRGRDAAALLFTSGSTGRPKGVLIPHRAICNHALWMEDAGGIGTRDVTLQRTPFTFDVALWEIFGTLIAGGRIALPAPDGHRDAAYLANFIAEDGVTVMQGVPSIVRVLVDEPRFRECRSLRAIYLGGEVVTPDLVARLHADLPWVRLYNVYGPTEATIDATCWPIPVDRNPAVVPIGRAIGGASAYILSRAQQPQPVGVPGELFVGGAGVGLGYMNRPELTAERFLPDPFQPSASSTMYRTGDRARWLDDGQIEFLGRLDDQIKLRGVRIEIGEVEAALRASPGVAAGAVAVRGQPGAEQLVAYFVSENDTEGCSSGIRSRLMEMLPLTLVPTAYVRLAELPRTSSEKIDYRALPDPGEREVAAPMIAPRTAVEAVVASIWMDVLAVSPVGVETSFFDLGGHSLLSTRILGQISRIFRTQLPLRRFFETPTIAGVARLLEAAESTPGRGTAVARAFQKIQQMTPDDRDRLRREKAGIDQTPESL